MRALRAARLHPARRSPKDAGRRSDRTRCDLRSYQRGRELEQMVLDELRSDLRERMAAGRRRARQRHCAVGDGDRLVVVPRSKRKLAQARIGRRRRFHARRRDAQADGRLARLAVGLEHELALLDREVVAMRPEHLARRLEYGAHHLGAQLGEAGEKGEPFALELLLALLVGAPHHVAGVEDRAELIGEAPAHGSTCTPCQDSSCICAAFSEMPYTSQICAARYVRRPPIASSSASVMRAQRSFALCLKCAQLDAIRSHSMRAPPSLAHSPEAARAARVIWRAMLLDLGLSATRLATAAAKSENAPAPGERPARGS